MTSDDVCLIGEHPSIVDLRRRIERVAPSKAGTVLIYGETGTGKGMVARLIHAQSQRAAKPFVDINCAAIPVELLESELFGHERGAFTGAIGKKEGLIEAASGGSVFLDEIRELDAVMQAKILTLLDTKRFRRVGAVTPIHVDVRFIAATNKILLQEVNAGKFRDDLYYRLQVISINIPPLRERGDDVFLLADNFLRKYQSLYGGSLKRLDHEVEQVFREYAWPGNVRELENLMERICLLEEGEWVREAHLPARILREVGGTRAHAPVAAGEKPAVTDQLPLPTGDYHEATRQFQSQLIGQALAQHQHNIAAAAQQLGLTRHALRHQMIKLGLHDDE